MKNIEILNDEKLKRYSVVANFATALNNDSYETHNSK